MNTFYLFTSELVDELVWETAISSEMTKNVHLLDRHDLYSSSRLLVSNFYLKSFHQRKASFQISMFAAEKLLSDTTPIGSKPGQSTLLGASQNVDATL